MSTNTVSSATMHEAVKSRFVGCILGGLIGDALGAKFEFKNIRGLEDSVRAFIEDLHTKTDAETRKYTDDTAMTISVIESLAETKNVDALEMAKRFVTAYFLDRKRRYGASVQKLFALLKKSEFSDIYGPAQASFDGSGSLGNGAAMRAAPFGLVGMTHMEILTNGVVDSSKVTHAHPVGICGAIFQAVAVREALLIGIRDNDSKNTLIQIRDEIITNIESTLRIIKESSSADIDFEVGMKPYFEGITTIRELLNTDSVSLENIRTKLGTAVTADKSVPTSLYCFLAGFLELKTIEVLNPKEDHFVKSIQLAISLGGDTDTIASMAGAIAGAYLGWDKIPTNLLRHCEGNQELKQLAEKLFEAFHPLNQK